VQCSVVYRIDVTNDKPKSFLQVTTDDLIHVPFGGESTSVKPLVYPLPIVIVTLQHGESLKARVIVAKGVGVYVPELFANPSDAGSTGGKWNFCTVSLREDPAIEIDTSCLKDEQLVTFHANAKSFSRQCAMQVFEAKQRLEIVNVRNCSECGRCREILTELQLPKTTIKFTTHNDRWLLKLRKNGMLHAADALLQIVAVVKKKEQQLYEDAFPLRAMWKKLKANQ
jgi:ferredoxin-like protein FixX